MEVAAKPALQPTFWTSIREALRGSHQDFTAGDLNRAILLLAIPMVLEMVLESLFGVVDVFWVSRLGADAVATVGLTESMLFLVFAVAMGLSLSTTAMVARRIGEKDPEGAAVAAVQAIILGLVASAVIGVPCLLLARYLLRWMGATSEIVAVGTGYATIALGGSGVVLMLFLNNAIFRGAGDAAIAMRLLWVSNVINLILDPCLIFGWGPFPRLGVTGAALATFTGRSIGVAYQFYRLLKGSERIRILTRQLRVDIRVLLRLVRVSLTGILQFAIAHTSWIGLVRIVSYGNIGYAYGMVMLQAFNGAGDTVTPTIVNFFGFWLLEIPLAYWLAIRMRIGPNGAFWSIVIAEGAIAATSAVLFKRGKWK